MVFMARILAGLILACSTPEACPQCTSEKLCAPHAEEESRVLSEVTAVFDNRDASSDEVIAALEKAGALVDRRENGPPDAVFDALALRLYDDDPGVRSKAQEIVLSFRNRAAVVDWGVATIERVLERLDEACRTVGRAPKIPKLPEKGITSLSKKQREEYLKKFEETREWAEKMKTHTREFAVGAGVAEVLGEFPDDRVADVLLRFLDGIAKGKYDGAFPFAKTAGYCSLAPALVKLGRRDGVRKVAEALPKVQNEECVTHIHEAFEAAVADRNLEPPGRASGDSSNVWRYWFRKNYQEFPEELGEIAAGTFE